MFLGDTMILTVVNRDKTDFASRAIIISIASSFVSSDHYITGVKWVSNKLVSVSWMNRAQNVSIISHCREARMWTCTEVSFFFNKKWHPLYSIIAVLHASIKLKLGGWHLLQPCLRGAGLI